MKNYDDYVQEARMILGQISQQKSKIAQMAIDVCQIRHGGRSDSYYTISDFAEAIGLPTKTLQNWIYIYRDVLVKIGITDPTEKEWAVASKTCDYLKTQRTVENLASGSVGTRRAYKQDVKRESVAKVFEDISQGSNSDLLKFERIFSSVRFNHTMLTSMDLKEIDQGKLVMVMNWLDGSSDVINDFLTNLKKSQKAS